jgi:sulfur carrier protein
VITLTVNGEARELPEGASVEALLEALELHRQPCAVEVNRRLVPKRDHRGHALADGDAVEIVTLVGGG